ncbi:hypothetical protein [Mesorhizobium sp.]|uniref:hypothetical protein n=1 Tax=Mesorhizobium sp. TaxID=1871066 RepID=UPI00257AA68D|nr:hypothetical protein [Mesorhizobium sp.]
MSEVEATEPLTFHYKNYRGEHSERRVLPRGFRFGTSEFHPKPQWLLIAYDLDKKALREFSFEEIRCPETGGWWSRAFDDVATERRRQVEGEDCTPESDDKYRDGEMARAAGIYAIIAGSNLTNYRNALGGYYLGACLQAVLDHYWPFHRSWFKPTTRRRDLVKAGALIVAEIERIDREAN